MSRLIRNRILSAAVLALSAAGVSADVVPRLGENVVRPAAPGAPGDLLTTPGPQTFPAVVDLNLASDDPSTRRFAVAWLQRVENSFENFETLQVAIVDSEGDLIAGPAALATYRTSSGSVRPSNPAIAVDGNGYFTVSWSVVELDSSGGSRDFNQKIHARTFRPEANNRSLCPADGLPIFADGPDSVMLDTALIPELNDVPGNFDITGPRLSVDIDSSNRGATVLVFPDHRGAQNWGIYAARTELVVDNPLPDPTDWCEVAHARLVPPGSALLVGRNGEFQAAPRVAVDLNSERSVVAWRSFGGSIVAQRLTAGGDLLGDLTEVAAAPDDTQQSVHDPDVGYGPDGRFWVTWERNQYSNFDSGTDARSEILASRFDRNGLVVESNVVIDSNTGSDRLTMFSLRNPRVQAMDLDGDASFGWSRLRDECPDFGGGFRVDVPSNSACSADGERILLPPFNGSCELLFVRSSRACRGQVRSALFDESVPISSFLFDPVGPRGWAVTPTAATSFSITYRSIPLTGDMNRCGFIEHTGADQPQRILVEQPCRQADCVTCAEQAEAAGVRLPDANVLEVDSNRMNGEDGPARFSRLAAFADTDLRLRWLQAQFSTEDATRVEATTISDQALVNSAPALAMGRSGDMMMAWIAEDVPNPDPKVGGNLNHALVTQNLTGPVELSINDVGILEGPVIRATGNFTLTANKPYPVRPGECTGDTPRPSVSLLTADGSASFLSGDYTRTAGTLAFDPCDPLASLSLGFPVPVEDDGVFEDTESFFVDLFDEQNAIVVRRQGTGAIIDNDLPSTVSGPSGIIEVCEDGTRPLADAPRCPGTGSPRSDIEIGLTLDIAQEVEGSVEFLTMDGSAFGDIGAAVANSDYEPVSGELQFLPGTKEAFLSIELVMDQFAELPEQFFVELVGAENLTLPADSDDLQIRVNIIDDDVCATPPAWFLPDPGGTVPDTLPTHGTEAERSGYFCVVNPEGFDTCPWEARLDLAQGEEPWLERTNIPFSAPPDGVTDADVVAAQSACALISGATGAIRYLAEENLPDPNDQTAPVQSRTQSVLFINGAAEPDARDVTQAGGNCTPIVTPSVRRFFPVGGAATFDVSFGDEPACEFAEWSAQVDSSAADWLSIDGASFDTGRFTFNGPGSFAIEVDPFTVDVGPVSDRIGVINIGDGVRVIQEAPLFDHFDDETPPSPLGWQYLEPDAWTETGTHLTAFAPGQARIIAEPAFPGCSLCQLETTVRIDTFGKGQATIYMWWRDEGEHLRLVVDEFFDNWTLIQRVAGVDHELRVFSTDVLVGREYPVRMEYRDDLGAPLITVDIDGQAMCPAPGPGLQPCTPWDPDPENDNVDPVIGSGTVGLGAAATTASFNLMRVIRADEPRLPLDGLFIDGFEALD